jgi:hypothetical protein
MGTFVNDSGVIIASHNNEVIRFEKDGLQIFTDNKNVVIVSIQQNQRIERRYPASEISSPSNSGADDLKRKLFLMLENYGTGYKNYVAALSQSGTNAPVASVRNNDLGFEPTFERSNVGQYGIQLPNIPQDKVVVFLTAKSGLNSFVFTLISDTIVPIITYDENGDNQDSILINCFIEIRIYN